MLNKLLSFIVLVKYGRLPIDIRYFYRDTYYCQLVQLKYILRDYIFKRKYKDIDFQGEFAPELQFVLPFAYWHYKNGTLKKTEGCTYTKEMYFFSPAHSEPYDIRTEEGNYNYEMPRILYSQNYDMKKWLPVPFKQYYQNSIYKYDKPILIIANRYNMEWGGQPISFFSIEILSYILEKVKGSYTVIYNRPRPHHITMDNSDIYDLNEHKWLEESYPEVILMENLFKENKGSANNFNHLQLMVYANADKFISIHGGTATLASYFGGINLILSKKGPEHHFNCYHKLYPKLSGAKIIHAKTDDEVKNYVDEIFAKEIAA
ncbi:hypothetical protein [Dyadobacter arcticus]|uniref:Glycosyltransferase family 61 protein n=1 Tax=Dyadobacter arcticus TaxID=1078754 RepID=A0ABX0UKX4_9BACT|nr:hypothetical protein [Dyadobacter arcticus]NIJ53648.1 hypothetical protein [Dyadobacter arcticus]